MITTQNPDLCVEPFIEPSQWFFTLVEIILAVGGLVMNTVITVICHRAVPMPHPQRRLLVSTEQVFCILNPHFHIPGLCFYQLCNPLRISTRQEFFPFPSHAATLSQPSYHCILQTPGVPVDILLYSLRCHIFLVRIAVCVLKTVSVLESGA